MQHAIATYCFPRISIRICKLFSALCVCHQFALSSLSLLRPPFPDALKYFSCGFHNFGLDLVRRSLWFQICWHIIIISTFGTEYIYHSSLSLQAWDDLFVIFEKIRNSESILDDSRYVSKNCFCLSIQNRRVSQFCWVRTLSAIAFEVQIYKRNRRRVRPTPKQIQTTILTNHHTLPKRALFAQLLTSTHELRSVHGTMKINRIFFIDPAKIDMKLNGRIWLSVRHIRQQPNSTYKVSARVFRIAKKENRARKYSNRGASDVLLLLVVSVHNGAIVLPTDRMAHRRAKKKRAWSQQRKAESETVYIRIYAFNWKTYGLIALAKWKVISQSPAVFVLDDYSNRCRTPTTKNNNICSHI